MSQLNILENKLIDEKEKELKEAKDHEKKLKKSNDIQIWNGRSPVTVKRARELILSQIPVEGFEFQSKINEDNITEIRKSLHDNTELQISNPEKEITNEIVKQIFEKIGKHALSYVKTVDFKGCKGLKMNGFITTLLEYCPNVERINLRNCGLEKSKIKEATSEIARCLRFGRCERLKQVDFSNNPIEEDFTVEERDNVFGYQGLLQRRENTIEIIYPEKLP